MHTLFRNLQKRYFTLFKHITHCSPLSFSLLQPGHPPPPSIHQLRLYIYNFMRIELSPIFSSLLDEFYLYVNFKVIIYRMYLHMKNTLHTLIYLSIWYDRSSLLPMMATDGSVAIVTGAAQGIGKCITKCLLSEGYQVGTTQLHVSQFVNGYIIIIKCFFLFSTFTILIWNFFVLPLEK